MSGWGATLAAVALVLIQAVPPAAAKERSDPISKKIEQERQALEKLKSEIEEKRKQAEETEKKRESVLQTIQDLDHRLLSNRQEHRNISRRLKEKDREIGEINVQLVELGGQIDGRRHSILSRLRVQYMEGRLGYLKPLLSAENYELFQRRLQYLSSVSEREYDLIESYRRDVARLEKIERQRETVRGEILGVKQHTERKLADIQELKRQKNLLLARIIDEKESFDRAVTELERSAARVDRLLRELEERRKARAIVPKKEPKGPMASPVRGALQWPVDGQVISFFGRQKHRTFEAYVQRKGIEIRADEGSEIHAVMPGTVVYADWLKGYGLVLILDHLNGFFSLYAHASKLTVKVGEHVAAGHVIGETGDTGLTGDNNLYFELREGAEPIDPLVWLAKRPERVGKE